MAVYLIDRLPTLTLCNRSPYELITVTGVGVLPVDMNTSVGISSLMNLGFLSSSGTSIDPVTSPSNLQVAAPPPLGLSSSSGDVSSPSSDCQRPPSVPSKTPATPTPSIESTPSDVPSSVSEPPRRTRLIQELLDATPVAPPPPQRTHTMVTKSMSSTASLATATTRYPILAALLVDITPEQCEPVTYSSAAKHPLWQHAMQQEY
ncbi:PREDICTED: uclacyanin-3-like [Nelumbo nucifera]|uniref:Uclacyanin-3-like n=1 Tax=Nelumbo nucifera TaxID=4432 RepID=A0A1U7ZJG9_NELNU|nr:PREDICTED: uclacyanin-3-like [Nelumbo nucifera]